jgi:hypothetical protein
MILVLVVLCLMLTGCGAVGDPLPPLLDIPQPSIGLAAAQRGDKVLVSWPAPLLTTENAKPRPDRLGPIKIYRFVLSDLEAKAPDRYTQPSKDSKIPSTEATVYQNAKEIATRPPGTTVFKDDVDPAWFNHTVVYAIKMTNRRGESADYSNMVPVAVLKVGPPPSFTSEVTEHAVKLRWNAGEGEWFRVYRDGAALGDVTGSSFDDQQFEFDHPYVYTIRTLARSGEFTAESDDSAPKKVRPEDHFPPATPMAVRAVQIEGVAEISWSPNTEPDLAGYNVYRGTVRLNDKLIVNTVFRDPAPGASPRYTVTAVDTHNNESKHSEEVRP